MFLGARLGKVGEGEEQCGDAQAYTHYHQTGEVSFYLVLEEQTYDAHRNHRHDDVQGIFRLFIHLKLKQSLQDPVNLTPEDDQCRKNRSHMHSHSKLQVIGSFDTEKCGENGQMTTRTDGQILRQSLYQS